MDKKKYINKSVSDPDEFGKEMKSLSESDFDGHTEFSNLSFKERLMWLSQAVQFSFKYKKTKKY